MANSSGDFSKAMRSYGESSRSEAFKAERQRYIDAVDTWLAVVADYADKGAMLPNGEFARLQPRISISYLGRSATGGRANAVAYESGVSLTGDGVETPLHLQAVEFKQDGSSIVTEVLGSDPISPAAHGNYSLSQQQDIVTRVSQQTTYGDGSRVEFDLSVFGDGKVRQQFLSAHGINTAKPLTDVNEVSMASNAAQSILHDIA